MSPERVSGALLVVAAVSLTLFGIPSFLAPSVLDWVTREFPWTVGPFLAQTIGAWAIGTAFICVQTVRRRDPALMYPLLVYLWLFGIGQLLVVFFFLDRLQTGHLLTWPYLAGLLALVGSWLASVVGQMSRSAGGSWRLEGQFVPTWAKAFGVVVGLFVLFLAIGTLVAGPDGATARGEIFPEPMGLFSIRAFSAFLFAIAGSIGAVLLARSLEPYVELGWAGLSLVVPITLAALLNLEFFSFNVDHPGNALYLLAYVVVGLLIAAVLIYLRRHPEGFAQRR